MSDDIQTTPDTAEAAPAQTQIQLPINDMVVALQAIQLASQRGAYQPGDFSSIGGSYERIFNFLVSVGAVGAPEATQETTEDATQETAPETTSDVPVDAAPVDAAPVADSTVAPQ